MKAGNVKKKVSKEGQDRNNGTKKSRGEKYSKRGEKDKTKTGRKGRGRQGKEKGGGDEEKGEERDMLREGEGWE